MRALLVVNAAASSVTARRRTRVEKVLGAEVDLEVARTMRRGHAMLQARAAARRGADCVIVLGGDGTLNEVMDALAGTDCAVAALPGGSTNVFARILGLPDDPVRAARVVVESLLADSVVPIGLGEVNGRHFSFHTGIGWDAALVADVERRGWLKRYAGHGLFVWSGVRTLLGGYDRREPHFSLLFDDGHVIEDGYFSVVLNSDPYTYVGHRPFVLAPTATLARPLSVVTLTSLEVPHFLRLLRAALSGDGLVAGEGIEVRDGVTGLTVRRRTTMPYQVDGDYLGTADTLRFDHRPDAVRLVVPVGWKPD